MSLDFLMYLSEADAEVHGDLLEGLMEHDLATLLLARYGYEEDSAVYRLEQALGVDLLRLEPYHWHVEDAEDDANVPVQPLLAVVREVLTAMDERRGQWEGVSGDDFVGRGAYISDGRLERDLRAMETALGRCVEAGVERIGFAAG